MPDTAQSAAHPRNPQKAQRKAARRKKRAKAAEEAAAQAQTITAMARPRSSTDAMVASIADQLCAIVDDDYDMRISVTADEDNLQVQKLTMLINALLENVRRNIGALSDLADGLERKVRDRTLKLDLIVQGSNDGVWLWDIGKDEVEYSYRWRQLLGLEADTLSGMDDWLRRVHPDDQERLRAALRAHLQGTDQYLREDYRIQHADGTYRWMWCRGRCHRDETGRPTFMAGTQTDVHQMRSVDAATGLPNEDAFMAMLEDVIVGGAAFRAMIVGVPRVVSMKEDMDSDELSTLRKAIALRLSSCIPFGATLAHLSGDFYAVLVPASILKGAFETLVIEPVLDAFQRPFQTSHRLVWLDVACGVTMPIERSSSSSADVMRDAWTSYRWARSENQAYNVLSDAQLEAARDRAHMEQQVRLALERGWFVPYFQPIVDMQTGETLGFETLCRMLHPDMGTVPPGRFIPVAEGIGVMDQISMQMFDRALEQLRDWSAQGHPYGKLFLTVNLEAHQVMHSELPGELRDRLARYKIEPHLLKIEIVESSMIGNFAQAARQLGYLREIGVKIALDDFGTGYSSLEYLNELPFDVLKIDRTFVQDMEQDARKKSMVKMMCVLAETLGAEVCVEGIELIEQAEIAKEFNAAFGQGYLFAKPLPQSEMTQVLRPKAAMGS